MAKMPMRQFSAGKDIRFGIEARASILRGVNKLADAVQVTAFVYSPFFHPACSPPLLFFSMLPSF
jgi:hypothetical protein